MISHGFFFDPEQRGPPTVIDLHNKCWLDINEVCKVHRNKRQLNNEGMNMSEKADQEL